MATVAVPAGNAGRDCQGAPGPLTTSARGPAAERRTMNWVDPGPVPVASTLFVLPIASGVDSCHGRFADGSQAATTSVVFLPTAARSAEEAPSRIVAKLLATSALGTGMSA